MARTFKHALTGRAIRVSDDSRTARLVEADDNWAEVKPKKEAGDADSGAKRKQRAGNSGGRRKPSREGSDND